MALVKICVPPSQQACLSPRPTSPSAFPRAPVTSCSLPQCPLGCLGIVQAAAAPPAPALSRLPLRHQPREPSSPYPGPGSVLASSLFGLQPCFLAWDSPHQEHRCPELWCLLLDSHLFHGARESDDSSLPTPVLTGCPGRKGAGLCACVPARSGC